MYKFQPIVKTLVWGTERWVLSGVPGNESVVAEGPDAGRSIRDIWPGDFPLLVKFIDARLDLSIQVHPDDAMARRIHGCPGKHEMWYVTGADPGARLLCGFRQQVRPEDYSDLVESGRIADMLASYEVSAGDVFYLPAGRVHAICGGCRVAEIQQSSDITYRMYDYKRPGLDGKPRQLHTELAREAINYQVLPDYRTRYPRVSDRRVGIVRCPYFSTDLLALTREKRLSLKGCGDFLILVGVAGEAQVLGALREMTLREGEAILALPEDGPLHLIPSAAGATLLTSHL